MYDKQDVMNTIDWIGTAGAFLILLAYFCNAFRLLSSRSRLFFALNTVGATLACMAFFLLAYWPFMVLEGAWMLVSLIGLIKASRSAKN